jgi:hypothetical protein
VPLVYSTLYVTKYENQIFLYEILPPHTERTGGFMILRRSPEIVPAMRGNDRRERCGGTIFRNDIATI